jgi:dTDP-glucose 4,6-dehydratase|tara:strand:- start:81 stop:1064 length:984 start_codon:yes stop_codon:yes gene_type:complete
MKLLVTGGLGFIGSNFISHILKKYDNHKIINIDNELIGSNHNYLSNLENPQNYSFVKGSITNKKLMTKLISDCDVIINFAAESHVDRSISNPKPFIDSNILGVFNILEILKTQKKRLVHISTDEVFGSLRTGSANEEYRLNPSSPYSASKASAELLINSYVHTFNIDSVITRCTNNYGPHQYPEKLIPKTIILAHRNEKIPIYGNGKSIRDWIFVEDHCDAIMKVLFKGNSGETYNISSQNELDNLTIVKKILKLMNKSLDLMEFVNERPGEDHRYSLDSLKIRTKLKWNHKINFEDGIRKTIEWYLIKNPWEKIDSKSLKNIPWKR